jgi:hypothetical protein
MCRYAAPPGYLRARPAKKPKRGPLVPVIEAILDAAERLRYPEGSAARPLQPAQDTSHDPTGLRI